jgi:L-fucose isomerase-like protein
MSNTNNPIKVGVLFLGRRRPGFDMDWGKQMEERVRQTLKRPTFSIFEPSEKAIDDASLRRCMDACEEQKVDAIVLLQATMGDGRLAPTLAQLWPHPLILWATPENQQGDMISSCSLVGVHCWASVLRQMGHSFELVYGDPDHGETQRRFSEAVRLAATVRRFKTLRVGVIGGQAPGYFAMSADPFTIHHGTGAQVQTYSLIEFSNVVNEISTDAVNADVAKVKALKYPHKDTTDEDLPMASRLYLGMKSFFETENRTH